MNKKNILNITYSAFLLAIILNSENIFNNFKIILSVFSPVFIGICITFIVNLPLKLIEPHLSKKMKPKSKRTLAIILSFSAIFCFLLTVAVFLVPQINESIITLRETLPKYMSNLENTVLNIATKFNVSNEILNQVLLWFDEISSYLGSLVLDILPKIFNFTMGVANKTINFFIGFVMSFYMLSSKEGIILGLKRFIRVIFPKNIAKYLFYVSKLSNKTFEAFITGQLLDSFILGSLCTIGLLILQIDYAVLIGVIVGISSLIPILGSILGTIPCFFILLVVNPRQALIFLIFIFLLQQLEGDLIYPRIVGKSIGISGLWVMLAMIIGGSISGLVGLILGVPIFAILHTLINEWIEEKLEKETDL